MVSSSQELLSHCSQWHNSLERKITKRRVAKHKVEESIIDMVIVSSDLLNNIESLEIDEARNHILTRIRKTKKGIFKKESDHNVLITTFKDTFKTTEKKEKTEMYSPKNKECQKAFKAYTSNTNMLSSVLNADEDIDTITERLVKKVNGCIAMNFKKVRITRNKKNKLERRHDRMRDLKKENKHEELEKVVEEVAIHEEER